MTSYEGKPAARCCGHEERVRLLEGALEAAARAWPSDLDPDGPAVRSRHIPPASVLRWLGIAAGAREETGGQPTPAGAGREQRLVDAHQATIGELRAAQARVRQLEAEVTAARWFAGELRGFCSPHGVAVHYAEQLETALDRARKEAGR